MVSFDMLSHLRPLSKAKYGIGLLSFQSELDNCVAEIAATCEIEMELELKSHYPNKSTPCISFHTFFLHMKVISLLFHHCVQLTLRLL